MSDYNKEKSLFKKKCGHYLAWINSQLKKKPNTKLVNDLSGGISDGVVLIQLIEIVAGVALDGAHLNPQTEDERLHNIKLVLMFMKSSNIPMHNIYSEEIVSGDLKSIMRLVLALAAYYKPNSIRHSTTHKMAAEAYVHSASTTLAEVRQYVSSVSQRPKNPLPNTSVESNVGETVYVKGHQSGYCQMTNVQSDVLEELAAAKSIALKLLELLGEKAGNNVPDGSIEKNLKTTEISESCGCAIPQTIQQMRHLLNQLESYHNLSLFPHSELYSDVNYLEIMEKLHERLNALMITDYKSINYYAQIQKKNFTNEINTT